LGSSSRTADRLVRALACGLALLAAGGIAVPARAQDDVRIDLSTDQTKRVSIQLEALGAAGDHAASTSAAQAADLVLAADLANSGVFDVALGWENDNIAPPGIQAFVGGKVTLTGGSLMLSGDVKDVPARRLIAHHDYRGGPADLRRLVHQFADDVALALTGEPGVAATQIAYVQKGARASELWVADMDGFGARPLTAFHSPLTSPSWQPDGRGLVFSSLRGAAWNLYGVTLAGASRVVTKAATLNISPALGPDGTLAFASNRDGNSEIYVATSDGGNVRRLTVNRAIDTSPSWSPNGQRLAFTSDRAGNAQVYVMDRDGGNQRKVLSGFSYTDSPDWSPRGDRLAFVVRTGGGFDIWVANADGSGPRPLVTGGSNENPHWAPNGRLIVFSSNRGGTRGIWITDLAGQMVRRLEVPGIATNPAWSPRPPPGFAGSATRSTTEASSHPNPGR
jgi:TolB protein